MGKVLEGPSSQKRGFQIVQGTVAGQKSVLIEYGLCGWDTKIREETHTI